jgi:hypothetical protein
MWVIGGLAILILTTAALGRFQRGSSADSDATQTTQTIQAAPTADHSGHTSTQITTSLTQPTPLPTPGPYTEAFDGKPDAPQPWKPADWDVVVHSRDVKTWKTLEPMDASHGHDCAGPPATHHIDSYDDAVFLCRDHVMTSLTAGGYGVIYLTPQRLLDFAEGESVLRFDMSTLRTSTRDWVDVWISPFEDNLSLPLETWLPDLNGPPRRGIHLRMDVVNGKTVFKVSVIRDFKVEAVKGNWTAGYDTVLTPDPARRDTFELRLSRTHVAFGMPAYNLWWVDRDIEELDWGQGVVQFGHHSYNPKKDCPKNKVCAPNTWHWDNVSMSRSTPFALVRADQRYVDGAGAQTVTFAQPAPEQSHLRFSGYGRLEVSFDDGQTWQAATRQAQVKNVAGHFNSYWMPVPTGVARVQFRAVEKSGRWMVRDISMWGLPLTLPQTNGAPGSR